MIFFSWDPRRLTHLTVFDRCITELVNRRIHILETDIDDPLVEAREEDDVRFADSHKFEEIRENLLLRSI